MASGILAYAIAQATTSGGIPIVVTGVALIASAVRPTPDDDESAGHG